MFVDVDLAVLAVLAGILITSSATGGRHPPTLITGRHFVLYIVKGFFSLRIEL